MKNPEALRGVGLRDVPTARLCDLLRAVHREDTQVPLSPAGIAALGLQDWSPSILGHLRGLDARGLRAVLVAVLAERRD